MATPAFFDYETYMDNKLAQMQKADPTGNWTMTKLVDTFAANDFLGEEGAYNHFVQFGAAEDVAPNDGFDAMEYYAAKAAQFYGVEAKAVTELQVANIKAAIASNGMNAWTHYQQFGSAEGVNPSNSFDAEAYCAAKATIMGGTWTAATVAKAIADNGMTVLDHYLTYAGKGTGEVAEGSTYPVSDDNRVPSDVTGKTFTLTANADNIVGTSGDDLVTGVNNAQVTTFSAVDSIDGGAGVDTLKLELNANYAGGAAIKNIEKLSLTMTAGGAFDTNGIAGLTNVAVNAGVATTFQNLANVVDAEISNTAVVTTLLQFADAAVAGTSDKVNVTLNNVTGAAAVNVDSVTALTAGVEEVGFITTGSNSSVTLASNDSSIAKVTVEGDKNLTLALNAGGGNTQTSVRTIDASSLTGNLMLSGLGAVNHTVTGGSGNDTFNFAGNFGVGDKVDGGEGTDTLAVTQAITAAQWAGVKNIETVAFTMGAGVSQDASLLTGVTTFNTSGAFTQTLTKLAADAQVGVVGNTTTLTASLADVTGLTDALNLSLNTATGAAGVILGTLTNVAGIEQINIVTNGNSNAVTNVITNDNVTAKHVITGAASLQLTNTAATVIDASGMTGNLTVSAGTVGNDNYQGGSGNDVLFGGGGNDVLVGNAGNDQLTGGAGADILKGGDGVDTFTYTTLSDSLAAGPDHILDFVAGVDKIDVTTVPTAIQQGAAFTAAGTGTLATDILSAIAAGTLTFAANNAAVVTITGTGAGTYLVINDGTAGYLAANDAVINITGITGTLAVADFV